MKRKISLMSMAAAIAAVVVFGFQNCSGLDSPGSGGSSVSNSQSSDIVFDSVPNGTVFYAGTTGVVGVLATSKGGHPLSYQWYKSGVAIPGQNTDTLSLPNIQQGDAAKYKLVVSNSTGSNFIEVDIAVSTVPVISISTQPQPITIQAAASGNLSVVAASSDGQSLIYQWYKDNVSLVGFNTPTIAVANAAPVVAGLYHVEVRSTVGPQQIVKSNTVKVTVQGTIALGATGCVNGYCACVTPGQINVPYAPSALAICVFKGYTSLITFSTTAGIRGATICGADGGGCFVNANPGNITCSSVTCSR